MTKYKYSILSDFHFNHEAITSFERPFHDIRSHNKKVKEVWFEALAKSDTFYFLGDFGRFADFELEQLAYEVSQYDCEKVLLQGNHDSNGFCQKLIETGVFDTWYKYSFSIGHRVHLSHWPEAVYPDTLNIHGHLHNSKLYDINHYNANIHINHYVPLYAKKVQNTLIPKLPAFKREFLTEPWSDDTILVKEREDLVYDKKTRRLNTAATRKKKNLS